MPMGDYHTLTFPNQKYTVSEYITAAGKKTNYSEQSNETLWLDFDRKNKSNGKTKT